MLTKNILLLVLACLAKTYTYPMSVVRHIAREQRIDSSKKTKKAENEGSIKKVKKAIILENCEKVLQKPRTTNNSILKPSKNSERRPALIDKIDFENTAKPRSIFDSPTEETNFDPYNLYSRNWQQHDKDC